MSFAPVPTTVPVYAIETVSGRYVDAVNPDPKDIDVIDIAWALSRQARFAGHTLGDIYNVAQHSRFVMELVEYALSDDAGEDVLESLRNWLADKGFLIEFDKGLTNFSKKKTAFGALTHDETEAYLIDLPSPVKRQPELRGPYKKLENTMKEAIAEALNLPKLSALEHEIVVWADLMALQIEAANLMPSRGRGWNGDLPLFKMENIQLMPKIEPWKVSYHEFLKEFNKFSEYFNSDRGTF